MKIHPRQHRSILNGLVVALLGLALGSGCTATPRAPFQGEYPGVLRAPERLATDVLWRQRVTASWGEDQSRGFDAAVQKSGETLTVLGLSPVGSVGFSIVQRGADVQLENRTGEHLPFPPRFILLDVQRAFYPWLDGAPADGRREGTVDGEHVRETWSGGRLVERRFARLDGEPAGEIVVRYRWDRPEWRAPSGAELENGWFGYRLSVETLEETLLGGEG